MFNIVLGIYIIVAIVVLGGGSYQLQKSSQTTAAVLFFLGALVLFIVFGNKWFGSSSSVFSSAPVSWPPTINTCPDYLVSYQRTMPDGTSQDTCIDRLGVSKNGALKLFPADGVAPANDDFYFSLATKRTDSAGRNQELCQRAIAAGLTWEGITNGESCITPAGPVAPVGPGTGTAAGTAGCPAATS
jgi:hypothetical protein